MINGNGNGNGNKSYTFENNLREILSSFQEYNNITTPTQVTIKKRKPKHLKKFEDLPQE